MKIKCTADNYSETHSFTIGKTYEIIKDLKGYKIINNGGTVWCNGRQSEEIVLSELRDYYGFEVVPEVTTCELHITCNDGKTTNAVYKVNGEIVERKQAVCAPSDTFNFATGAQTAFDRVFPKATPTQPIAPQEDKAKENGTLYCIKSDDGWCKFEKGNTYEYNGLCIREGTRSTTYIKNSDWFKSHFVKLVKRPAKVGEWVYITKSCDDRAAIGKVYQVAPYGNCGELFIKHPSGKRCSDGAACVENSEYLVLDGYVPEEKVEPEKPKYWSGEVVCFESKASWWTIGNKYTITNGKISDNAGCTYTGISDIENLNLRMSGKFIPYLGEA